MYGPCIYGVVWDANGEQRSVSHLCLGVVDLSSPLSSLRIPCFICLTLIEIFTRKEFIIIFEGQICLMGSKLQYFHIVYLDLRSEYLQYYNPEGALQL